jgi:hypothetical protein
MFGKTFDPERYIEANQKKNVLFSFFIVLAKGYYLGMLLPLQV